MKKKYLTGLILIILLLPIMIYADDSAAQKVTYFKGDGSLEDWFMSAFKDLDLVVGLEAFKISYIGRTIGSLGCLIYLGYLGWGMQTGSSQWDIMPMIKPIIFGLILINWGSFVEMIQAPFASLATPSFSAFDNIEKEANDLRIKRYELQNYIFEHSLKIKAENEAKLKALDTSEKSLGDEVMEYVGDELSGMWDSISEFTERTNYEIQKTVIGLIDTGCLILLRVAVYLMFTIQKIWSYFLIILGPIAIGIALIPGFDSSLYNWIAKFININLYTFITMTSVNIGQQIIMAGYKFEISRYSKIVSESGELLNKALLLEYNTYNGGIGIVAFTAVGYLVTAASVLMTPTIADSIVSAGGAGIMTKGKQAVKTVLSVANKFLLQPRKGKTI